MKSDLIATHAAHERDLGTIREEAGGTYMQVIEMFDRTIKKVAAGVDQPPVEEPRRTRARLSLTPLPPDSPPPAPRMTTRVLEPSLSMSFGNKRKASEESDEEPEKKRPQVASTAPTKPSSLRHSESYDP